MIWIVTCERAGRIDWWTAEQAETPSDAASRAIKRAIHTNLSAGDRVVTTELNRQSLLELASRMSQERSLPGTATDLAEWSDAIGV